MVDQVLINGVNNPAAATAGTYTFIGVNENCSILVTFKRVQPQIQGSQFVEDVFNALKVDSNKAETWLIYGGIGVGGLAVISLIYALIPRRKR